MAVSDSPTGAALDHWKGNDDSPASGGYQEFAPRPPGLFAIARGVVDVSTLPPPLRHVFSDFQDNVASVFVGLTSDGVVREDLFPLRSTGISTTPVSHSAREFLSKLSPHDHDKALLPVDSPRWRAWINAFAPSEPHGVLLDTQSQQVRDAAMEMFEAALSPRGFDQMRDSMRINQALSRIAPGYEDTLREFMYWCTVFGEPSETEPWGFQMFGHHVCVNVFVVGGQLTIGPMFLGAEPRVIAEGEFAGVRAFDTELELGLALMDALAPDQRERALLSESVKWEDLPPHLAHPTEGRMRGSVARDNAVVPLEGIPAHLFDERQRSALRALIAHYIERLPREHAEIRMAEIDSFFDETYFAWAGAADVDQPFYYKVQSPVVFIELDAHAGIFLSNDDPQPFHIHTIVRTPNGNDYGKAWLKRWQAVRCQ